MVDAEKLLHAPSTATLALMVNSTSARAPVQEQEVLDRLSAHGIKPADYIKIKQIVSFNIPHGLLIFAQRFGNRSIMEVLAEVETWRRFLERDTLFSDDERTKVEHVIQGTEMVLVQAILEVNLLRIGPWILTGTRLPSGQDSQGGPEYLPPGLRLTTVHCETKEQQSVVISGEDLGVRSQPLRALKRAFEELGLWDTVARCAISRRITRAGRPQGWPVFTQTVIPPLYDYLIPYYGKPGHFSDKRDTLSVGRALYPKELFEDMLLILRFEHGSTFEDMTTPQLKAQVQHHLDEKQASSTKTSKYP